MLLVPLAMAFPALHRAGLIEAVKFTCVPATEIVFPALHRAGLIEAISASASCARASSFPRAFAADLERECPRLGRELLGGDYRPGRYVKIEIFDPKHRIVSAAPFRDRVVHQALCAVIAPLFETGFIPHTFANRKEKGTHRAVATYERYRDRCRHVLRCDIFRYFPAIDHAILKRDFRRRIVCTQTLALLDLVVDGSNAQEPVEMHFPGDDLFTPFARRRSLPIGNLTSQFFANLYLDPGMLAAWRERIALFLEGRRLRLHPRKTVIQPTAEPADFLGYTLLPDGRRRLPEAGGARFRHRLRAIKDRVRAGTLAPAEAQARLQAWEAHAAFAHTRKLRNAVLGLKGADGRRRPW